MEKTSRHCRCASTIRGQFPHCAAPESRENAGVGRPFALYIVRAMLSRIDSDPVQQSGLCGLVTEWGGFARGFGVTRPLTHSILALLRSSRMSWTTAAP